MKLVKILGAAAALIIIVTVFFAWIQPEEGHTEKSIVINAPAEAVFNEVNTYSSFTEWSPWAKMDSNIKYTYEGPDTGEGSKMLWKGKSIGEGSQWIEASTPHSSVKTIVDFKDLSGIFSLQYKITSEEGGTKITWIYDGKNEGFTGKFRWLFMKGPLNTQFDEGLHDLKYYIEKKSGVKS